MNGHPGRAMDVMLRLSKSTTEDLSVFIGVGSECRIKMMVFYEIVILV